MNPGIEKPQSNPQNMLQNNSQTKPQVNPAIKMPQDKPQDNTHPSSPEEFPAFDPTVMSPDQAAVALADRRRLTIFVDRGIESPDNLADQVAAFDISPPLFSGSREKGEDTTQGTQQREK